jgi:hypothetical protein
MGSMSSSYVKSEKFYGWHEYGIYLGEAPKAKNNVCINNKNCKRLSTTETDYCSCHTAVTNKDLNNAIPLNKEPEQENCLKDAENLENIVNFQSFISNNFDSTCKSLNVLQNFENDQLNQNIKAVTSGLTTNNKKNISLIKSENILNQKCQETINLKIDAHKLRNQYLNKLMAQDLLKVPESKSNLEETKEREEFQKLKIYDHKFHNSIIIFDWDDTLMFTSFLEKNNLIDDCNSFSISKSKLNPETIKKIEQLDEYCYYLLSRSIEQGDTYIITNAELSWVHISARKYYPRTYKLLDKIHVISARDKYEKQFKEEMTQWKINSFNNEVYNKYKNELLTNIVCIGDSQHEQDAAKALACKFKNVYTKTIKFRGAPTLDELAKQLQLTLSQFSMVVSAVKNLNVTVERRTN